MKEITIERALPTRDCLEALDEALRATLGDKTSGLTHARNVIRVHMSDDATEADENTARQLVLNHDFAKRTAKQQRKADVLRLLAERRPRMTTENLQTLTKSEALAEQVEYLMLEVEYLRGLLIL